MRLRDRKKTTNLREASLTTICTVFLSLGWPGERLYMLKDALISHKPKNLFFGSEAARFPISPEWFPLLVRVKADESAMIMSPGTGVSLRGELLNFEANVPLLISIAAIAPETSTEQNM